MQYKERFRKRNSKVSIFNLPLPLKKTKLRNSLTVAFPIQLTFLNIAWLSLHISTRTFIVFMFNIWFYLNIKAWSWMFRNKSGRYSPKTIVLRYRSLLTIESRTSVLYYLNVFIWTCFMLSEYAFRCFGNESWYVCLHSGTLTVELFALWCWFGGLNR